MSDAYVPNMVAKAWVYLPWSLDSLERNHYPEAIEIAASVYDPEHEQPLFTLLNQSLLKDIMQALVTSSGPIGPPLSHPFRFPPYREIRSSTPAIPPSVTARTAGPFSTSTGSMTRISSRTSS